MKGLIRAVPWALLGLSVSVVLIPRRGVTVPLYAARNGLMCGSCHFDPNGGGPRNDFGFTFEKNRHSMVADTSGEWKDLTLVNRVGDSFPLYFGVNQRFMLLGTSVHNGPSPERLGFFDMESSIHMAFQPHSRLTLVYTRDGFDSGSSTKEAYGKFGGFPLNGYVKAGRFRTPFGLRLDDHTVATRNGFLDFFLARASETGNDSLVVPSFLPYDPRQPDMGIEVGGDWRSLFGRVAYTDGGSYPLVDGVGNRAQALTAKLGYNTSFYQAGFSFYDDFHTVAPPPLYPVLGTRATRWGYYGLWHASSLALLYEVAAGTDAVADEKRNSLAWFGELDWRITQGINLRGRFDRMELARGTALSALNTHNRYALEGEFDPVPFAQLRWTLRYIDHATDTFPNGFKTKDERQAYLQFHFFY